MNTGRCLAVAVAVLIATATPMTAFAGDATLPSGHVTLVEEQVFGGEEGPEETVLFQVGGFAVDESGNVYVSEKKLHKILVFDSAGEVVNTIGAEGEGPGDVRRPGALVVCPDGDVIVYESGNARIQRIAENGAHVASVACLGNMAMGLTMASGADLYALMYVLPAGTTKPESTLRVVRYSAVLDTSETLLEESPVTSIVVGHEGNYKMVMAPYAPWVFLAALPDGNIVVGRSDRNEFRILSPSGRVVRTVALDGGEGAVTEAHKKAYWDRATDHGTHELPAELKAAVVFPDRLPYYSGLETDEAGRIYVRWGTPVGDSADYIVFDENGERLSRFTIDALAPRVLFRGGRIYAQRGSREELPSIVRYGIEPGAGDVSHGEKP